MNPTKEEIQEAIRSGRVGYQCCFCHNVIDDEVNALVFVSQWDKGGTRSKQWFCHEPCFSKAIDEPVFDKLDDLSILDDLEH